MRTLNKITEFGSPENLIQDTNNNSTDINLFDLQEIIKDNLIKRGYFFTNIFERLAKLQEECGELSKAVRDYEDYPFHDLELFKKVKNEFADIEIVLNTGAEFYGFKLNKAVLDKLEEDKHRKKRGI